MGSGMPDKITVIRTADAEDRECFIVSAPTLGELATTLGIEQGRFVVKENDGLSRQRRLQEINRRMNTPEAIRRRRDFDPFTGDPYC
jgi:hypothetical protein